MFQVSTEFGENILYIYTNGFIIVRNHNKKQDLSQEFSLIISQKLLWISLLVASP